VIQHAASCYLTVRENSILVRQHDKEHCIMDNASLLCTQYA